MGFAPNGDDWKGEHLIRGRGPEGHKLKRVDGVEVESKVAPNGLCKIEGCDARLDIRNVTGVCVKHRHKGRRYKKGGSVI